jgi:hypothetical protein
MKKLLTSNFFVMATMVLALVVLTNCNKDDDGDKPDGPPPTATLTTPVNAEPGKGITFVGTFNDELGLTGITLTNTDLGLAATISLNDEPLTYAMSYNFTIPETVQDGSYNVAVVASNTSQKTAEFTIAVVVESPVEIPDNYDAVWVAGGVLWWEWGTPEGYFYEMIKDEENPGWFEVDLQSWAGFNEIKFLGQNAWAPDNWGLVDNTDPNSDMVNDESSATVVLPDMDKNPAYYRVRFNPNTLEYNYEELIPDMEVHDKMYIVGSGFTDYPNLDWNPEEAIEMTHNPYEYGVYQFTAEGVMFSDDVAIKFIGQNDGWGPIDMGFAGESREVTAPQNWVVLVEGDGTADLKFKDQAGTYTIYLDYFLKRAVIWPE